MQFSVFFAAVLATAIAASPLDLPIPPKRTYSSSPTSTMPAYPYPTGTPYEACPSGLYSVSQCCATDILGIADLDCHSRKSAFLNKSALEPRPYPRAHQNSDIPARLTVNEPDAALFLWLAKLFSA
ncbi:hypothetical protein ONZ43_g4850 [Nemania bipapillata]|uniref:Uncharacterized protein n=1 Tax=Nemania bipapillata TaxID=110536 RepID=A0ACC2IHS5_9PEZI|nr:hypothetical protein ONZ43_g4850 [Nemania bipapillata]